MLAGAGGADVDVLDGINTRFAQHGADRGRNVEGGTTVAGGSSNRVVEAVDEPIEVGHTELVALGADARPDGGADVGGAERPHRGDRRDDDAFQQAAPTGVG